MFLAKTITKNSNLINYAINLHQTKQILPNSYVIDLDTLLKNAQAMLIKAQTLGIEMFYMAKQYGRIPEIGKYLEQLGYVGAVVVDHQGFEICKKNELKVAHIGHLSQVPDSLIKDVIEYGVQYVTFYSLQKMAAFNKIAKVLNKRVNAILKIIDYDNDIIYNSQMSGFELNDLVPLIKQLQEFSNIDVVGLTSFPCFTRDDENNTESPTNNLTTLKKAQMIFANHQLQVFLNLPSSTSVETLDKIKAVGGVQGEPGHALTGTVRSVAFNDDFVEIPAMVYVSEISHNFREKSYAYGGGYYARGLLQNALVVNQSSNSKKVLTLNPPATGVIDYYLELNNNAVVGDTVIMAFRTQIFVTRAKVVLVKGLCTNQPQIIGKYDSWGHRISES